MSILSVFFPSFGQGVSVTTAATTANEVIDKENSADSVVISNLGTAVAYVRTYDSNVSGDEVATIADYAVLGGSQIPLSKFKRHDRIAYIAPAGTPALHIIKGKGI